VGRQRKGAAAAVFEDEHGRQYEQPDEAEDQAGTE